MDKKCKDCEFNRIDDPQSLWELEAGTIANLSLWLRLSTGIVHNAVEGKEIPPELQKELDEMVKSANVMCDNALDWIDYHELCRKKEPDFVMDEFLHVRLHTLTPEGQKLKLEMYKLPASDIISEFYTTLMGRKATYLAVIRKFQPQCGSLLNQLQIMYDFIDQVNNRYKAWAKKWEK